MVCVHVCLFRLRHTPQVTLWCWWAATSSTRTPASTTRTWINSSLTWTLLRLVDCDCSRMCIWTLCFCSRFNNNNNKNLCGRDGRTICGPLCVPKSTYVTLAHKRKQKFFYFGCSLVRRFYCKIEKLHPITGQTDRRTDRQTECDAICGPLLGRRAA